MIDLITYRCRIGTFRTKAALSAHKKRMKKTTRSFSNSFRGGLPIKQVLLISCHVILISVLFVGLSADIRACSRSNTCDGPPLTVYNPVLTTKFSDTCVMDVPDIYKSFTENALFSEQTSSNIKVSKHICYSVINLKTLKKYTVNVTRPTKLISVREKHSYLLGNASVHAYNGNTGKNKEGSPESGTSRYLILSSSFVHLNKN